MKRCVLPLLALLAGGCATQASLGTVAPSPDYPAKPVRAFIGAPISVEHVGYACHTYAVAEDGSEECMYVDSVYRGRYRVVDTLEGPMPDGEVTLRMTGHGGVPEDVHRPFVLLLATETADGWKLLRYQAFAVQRTVDGRWATCGGDESVAVQFLPGADFGGVDQGWVKRILEDEPGVHEVRDGRLVCRRGVYADTIVRRM